MINTEVMKEITKLCAEYEKRWNKPVDFVGLPSAMNQERLLLAMRLIVDTGDSVLVGFKKVSKLLNVYYKYLDNIEDINDGENVEKNCPLCGNKVRYFIEGTSYEFKCDTPYCIRRIFRGI